MTAILPGHYVVLGASGMFGSHALQALAAQPNVTVTAVHNHRPVLVKAANIREVKADLLDRDACAAVMAKADYAFLFAGVLATAPVLARDPVTPVLTTLRINVNAFEAAHAAGVKHAVWMSSTTAYPPLEEELTEDRLFDGNPPPSWYSLGWATRYLETLGRSFAESFPRPMTVTSLRPTLAYGEFDHFDDATAHFLPALIRRVVGRERPIEVWGDGSQTRDLIYAGDVIGAIWPALRRTAGYDAFNIAHGQSFSVNDVLEKICRIDGFADAAITHLRDRPTSISNRRFSSARARSVLRFMPQTSLDDGLKRTIAWYRSQGARQK